MVHLQGRCCGIQFRVSAEWDGEGFLTETQQSVFDSPCFVGLNGLLIHSLSVCGGPRVVFFFANGTVTAIRACVSIFRLPIEVVPRRAGRVRVPFSSACHTCKTTRPVSVKSSLRFLLILNTTMHTSYNRMTVICGASVVILAQGFFCSNVLLLSWRGDLGANPGRRSRHELVERHGENLASHVLQTRERGRALRALPRNDPDSHSGKFQHYRSRLRGNTGG